MQALPSLFGLAPCGVYPAPGVTAGAVRSYRTISPLPRRWSCRNGKHSRQAGPTWVLRLQGGPRPVPKKRGRGSRGGFFSVALAVHEPLRSRPGRYPAHCPAEFGLSSPGEPCLRTSSGSDRPVLLPVVSVSRKLICPSFEGFWEHSYVLKDGCGNVGRILTRHSHSQPVVSRKSLITMRLRLPPDS